MKGNETRPGKTSFAVVGFAAGVLTVILVFLALRGC